MENTIDQFSKNMIAEYKQGKIEKYKLLSNKVNKELLDFLSNVCPKCGATLNKLSSRYKGTKFYYQCPSSNCNFILNEEYTLAELYLQGTKLKATCVECGKPLTIAYGSYDNHLYARCYECNVDLNISDKWINSRSEEARKEIEQAVNDFYSHINSKPDEFYTNIKKDEEESNTNENNSIEEINAEKNENNIETNVENSIEDTKENEDNMENIKKDSFTEKDVKELVDLLYSSYSCCSNKIPDRAKKLLCSADNFFEDYFEHYKADNLLDGFFQNPFTNWCNAHDTKTQEAYEHLFSLGIFVEGGKFRYNGKYYQCYSLSYNPRKKKLKKVVRGISEQKRFFNKLHMNFFKREQIRLNKKSVNNRVWTENWNRRVCQVIKYFLDNKNNWSTVNDVSKALDPNKSKIYAYSFCLFLEKCGILSVYKKSGYWNEYHLYPDLYEDAIKVAVQKVTTEPNELTEKQTEELITTTNLDEQEELVEKQTEELTTATNLDEQEELVEKQTEETIATIEDKQESLNIQPTEDSIKQQKNEEAFLNCIENNIALEKLKELEAKIEEQSTTIETLSNELRNSSKHFYFYREIKKYFRIFKRRLTKVHRSEKTKENEQLPGIIRF